MKAAPVVASVVVAWASGCTRGDGLDRTLVTGASAGSVHAEGTHGREWSRLYGASMVDKFRRAATNMDRIVKGAKPADLPVERPTKFEVVIKVKTAKALGLAIALPCWRGQTK